jgi:hypothetical protein
VTVVAYAGMTIFEDPSKFKEAKAATDEPEKVVVCISSLFYSYEGIALMLPIENSMQNWSVLFSTRASSIKPCHLTSSSIKPCHLTSSSIKPCHLTSSRPNHAI